MAIESSFKKLNEYFHLKTKPPAYQWQDLALKIIKDLAVPNFKKSSVFKICRDLPKEEVMKALNDTKELCQTPVKWKYFFKVIANSQKNDDKLDSKLGG